jgi:cysteine desulfurase
MSPAQLPHIYFDNAATTPLDPRVVAAMQPFLGGSFGNPSSLHWAGRQARAAVDTARAQVAELLNAQADEVVFTASGTEADNMALIGVAEKFPADECHIVTSAIEHPAVLESLHWLERRGVQVTCVNPNADGIVEPASLLDALRPTTRLVSIMAANNVIGTVQPIAELARISRAHGALFHTDAVQAAGKIPLDVSRTPIDLLSLSGHKLYGPKGVGALYVRKGVTIEAIIRGGGQERGLRSATENVAGIVALGCASDLARQEMADDASRLVQLRERLLEEIGRRIPNAYLIGHRYRRLPGHICLGFAGQEGEAIKLLLELDELGIAVSSGSACSAQHGGEPSHVLMALGIEPVRARGSLRVTLGRFNTAAEVERLLEVLPIAVAGLRRISSGVPASAA